MAASREWTEWHLTPRGWERGSEMVDVGNLTEVPPPADRVLTHKYREIMSSGFSPIDRYNDEIWRTDDEERIAELLKTFGSAPNTL